MDNAEITQRILQSTLHNLVEGMVAVSSRGGIIMEANEAASHILGLPPEELAGRTLMDCFGDNEENDTFVQVILDAVYDKERTHEALVPYASPTGRRELAMRTSFLMNGEEKLGILILIDDVTELQELRDAMVAMQEIRRLNAQLEARNQLISRAFGRYMSDAVVKELLEKPDGLAIRGRKCCVTVLMSDLRGFTARSEHMAAEDLIRMLNHYLERMTQIIQSRRGTIIELLGDGILAVFGAPADDPCHAANAAAAAIEMQNAMPDINAWNREQGFSELEMGIGINTGETIVGNIGSEMRTKYAVTGKTVNICGRIESYSVGGQILIGPETAAQIGCELRTETVIEVYPKGASQPMPVSSICAMGAPYDLEKNTPRQAELTTLEKPLAVTFRVIRDKHVDIAPTQGSFLSLSEQGGLLRTGAEMQLYENLEFHIGGQLYGKLVGKTGDDWQVVFTARPEEFTDWLRAALEG